jgi:hypothetical protein
VQRHQVDQGIRPVRLAAEAPGDRRGVDRVVEMGVADQHADDLSRRAAETVERRWVGQRWTAEEQVAERDAREVGIDKERPALVGEPVAGDAQPLDPQAARQLQALRSSAASA